jgi:hypothetical protein
VKPPPCLGGVKWLVWNLCSGVSTTGSRRSGTLSGWQEAMYEVEFLQYSCTINKWGWVNTSNSRKQSTVGSEMGSGALRSSDNETYSLRTPHARCNKNRKQVCRSGQKPPAMLLSGINSDVVNKSRQQVRFPVLWKIQRKKSYFRGSLWALVLVKFCQRNYTQRA